MKSNLKAKNKQTAESKQTAALIKNSKFSYLTTLYCISEAKSQSRAKGKQTAECKQTADFIKNPKFSYLTTLYCICIASVRPNLTIELKVNKQLRVKKQLTSSKNLNFHT